MLKGHDEHAFYLKELMRLLPISFEEVRKVYATECDLRANGYEEKANHFRKVKLELYNFNFDCRLRNGDLIEATNLNRIERKFLRMRYVRAWSWKQLFNTQGYSTDHCKRIHRDAVAKVAKRFPEKDFKAMFEQEHARLVALMESIGEKVYMR